MTEEVFALLAQSCALEEDIKPDSELKELSLDSLSFVEFIVRAEEAFGIEFDDEDLDVGRWKTVGACAEKIEELCRRKEK